MSVSYIPEKVKIRLWGKAAGRCEYEGCNKPLWLDSLTKAEFNIAYMAHIIADQPHGPRGDKLLSEKLKDDISNLMIMCDECHRRIDKEDVDGHPAERLQQMKRMHEERIELLTSIQEDKRSHVILYGANIGKHNAYVSWDQAAQAMVPLHFPADKLAVELGLKNSAVQDHKAWEFEKEQLRTQFQTKVKPLLASGDVVHFSVFALAPQPLLIELGRLLSDIQTAEVYQLHREPADWKWHEHREDLQYGVEEPDTRHPVVALNLSLSATIDNARISAVLDGSHSIWTMTVPDPNNDLLDSRQQLSAFRKRFRKLLNQIKAEHGEDAMIHVFPAVPVSVAVEIGRVWMPKADLPMRIYDQNRETGGFTVALDIVNQ